MDKEAFVYIGFYPDCKCVMDVRKDSQDKETAKAVFEMITVGLAVNRVSVEEYGKICEGETFLDCPHGKPGMAQLFHGLNVAEIKQT